MKEIKAKWGFFHWAMWYSKRIWYTNRNTEELVEDLNAMLTVYCGSTIDYTKFDWYKNLADSLVEFAFKYPNGENMLKDVFKGIFTGLPRTFEIYSKDPVSIDAGLTSIMDVLTFVVVNSSSLRSVGGYIVPLPDLMHHSFYEVLKDKYKFNGE